MEYRLALGTAAVAPIVGYEAAPGSLDIGREIQLEGAMWVVYELGDGQRAHFVMALAKPALIMRLRPNIEIELYASELARVRREVARLVDTRGEPAREVHEIISRFLTEDSPPALRLGDEGLHIVSDAIHAIEVSDGLSDHLMAVRHALRDYFAADGGQ